MASGQYSEFSFCSSFLRAILQCCSHVSYKFLGSIKYFPYTLFLLFKAHFYFINNGLPDLILLRVVYTETSNYVQICCCKQKKTHTQNPIFQKLEIKFLKARSQSDQACGILVFLTCQALGYASKYSTTGVDISTMVHQAFIRFISPLIFNNKGEHLKHTTKSNKNKYRLEYMHYLLYILMLVSVGGRRRLQHPQRLSAEVNSLLVDELIGGFQVFYILNDVSQMCVS